MDTSLAIASGVLAIYLILGPIVILGFHAFFDRMAEKADQAAAPAAQPPNEKDPSLWTEQDVRAYLKKTRHIRSLDRSADTNIRPLAE